MMVDFDPNNFPPDARASKRPGGWPESDIGSYKELWYSAENILAKCTKIKKQGWITSGEQDAIGVFLWTTNSVLDTRFKRQLLELQS